MRFFISEDNFLSPFNSYFIAWLIAFTTFGTSSSAQFNTLVGGLKTAVDLKLKEYTLEQVLQILESDYSDKIGGNKWEAKDTTR